MAPILEGIHGKGAMSTVDASAATRVWKNPYFAVALVVLLAAVMPFCTRLHSEWDDVYVRAAIDLQAGRDVYRQNYGYTYPPFQMLLALPFTALPHLGVRIGWFAVNAFCLAWMVTSAWAIAGGGRFRDAATWPWSEHAIFVLGLGCGVWYSFHALAHQQTDIVMAALFLGGCRWLQTGHACRGAILFGLATAMKCTPLLLAPYLVLRRRFLAAALVVAVALGVNLLPELVQSSPSGSTWLAEWFRLFLQPMADRNHAPGAWHSDPLYNQSLAGAFSRWTQTEWNWTANGLVIGVTSTPLEALRWKPALYGVQLVLAAAAGLVFCRRFRLHPERDASDAQWAGYEYGVVAILMLMYSPMSSIPHFATLILPGFCLARQAVVRRDRAAAVVVALASVCAALSNKDLQGGSLYTLGLWHGVVMLNALVLLAGLLTTLARWPARKRESQTEAPRLRAA